MNNSDKNTLLYAIAVRDVVIGSLLDVITGDKKTKSLELFQHYMNRANEHLASMPKQKVRKILDVIEFGLIKQDYESKQETN